MLKMNKDGKTVHEVLCIDEITFGILTAFTIHAYMTTSDYLSAADKALECILNCNHVNSMQPEYIVAVTKILGDMHYTQMDPIKKAITLGSFISEKLQGLEAQGIILELD